MNIKNKNYIGYYLIFLFGFCVFFWYNGADFICGNDTILLLKPKIIVKEYFNILSHNIAFSNPNYSKLSFILPIGLLFSLLNLFELLFNPILYNKIYVYFLFVSSGISIYYLYGVLFEDSNIFSRFMAALFYMCNFYVQWLWLSFSLIHILYSMFPLVLGFYINRVKNNLSIKDSLYISLFMSLISYGYGIPYLVIHWFIILLFLLQYSNKNYLYKNIKYSIYMFLSWFLINAFWLFPIIINVNNEFQRVINNDFYSQYLLFEWNSVNLNDAFRLMGYKGLYTTINGLMSYPWMSLYDINIIKIISYFIPIIVFSNLLIYKKKKNILFLTLYTIFFIFLVKGLNPPFKIINEYIFKQFNLYGPFRSVYQKFMGFIVIGFVILYARPIDYLHSRLYNRKRKKYFILIYTLFLIPISMISLPLLSGTIFNNNDFIPSRKIIIPEYYYDAANWLDAQEGEFNVLPIPIPVNNKLILLWANGSNGYIGKYPFLLLASKNFITDASFKPISILEEMLGSNNIIDSRFLNIYNVKYIVIHNDYNKKYYNLDENYLFDLENSISSIDGMTLVKKFNKLLIYENLLYDDNYIFGINANLEDLKIDAFKSLIFDDFYYNSFNIELKNGHIIKNNYIDYLRLQDITYENNAHVKYVLPNWNHMILEGRFKITNNNTFYPVIIKNEFIGYHDGKNFHNYSNFSIKHDWFNIRIDLDLKNGTYYIYLNEVCITQNETLNKIKLYETNKGLVNEHFIFFKTIVGTSEETGLIVDIDYYKILNYDEVDDIELIYNSLKNVYQIPFLIKTKQEIILNVTNYEKIYVVFNEKYNPNWFIDFNGEAIYSKPFLNISNMFEVDATNCTNLILKYDEGLESYSRYLSPFYVIIILMYLTKNHIKKFITRAYNFARAMATTRGPLRASPRPSSSTPASRWHTTGERRPTGSLGRTGRPYGTV